MVDSRCTQRAMAGWDDDKEFRGKQDVERFTSEVEI